MGLKGNRRTDTKEIEERTKANTRINIKLDDISTTTKDIKLELASVRSDIRQQNERLIRLEESNKSAHKRIDNLENRVNGVNGKEDI
jgi:chromosome segregation ATPase